MSRVAEAIKNGRSGQMNFDFGDRQLFITDVVNLLVDSLPNTLLNFRVSVVASHVEDHSVGM